MTEPSEKALFNEAAYDQAAPAYHATNGQWRQPTLLKRFSAMVTPGGSILDAGCGAGEPVAKQLSSEGFSVTGVDISSSMLALARRHVPGVTFLKGNLETLPFNPCTFDGIVSCYAVIHVPREKHKKIFSDFYSFLKPNSPLLMTIGNSDWEGTEEFCGARMFWSHYTPSKTLEMIRECGFRIEFAEPLEGGGETHFWVLCRS